MVTGAGMRFEDWLRGDPASLRRARDLWEGEYAAGKLTRGQYLQLFDKMTGGNEFGTYIKEQERLSHQSLEEQQRRQEQQRQEQSRIDQQGAAFTGTLGATEILNPLLYDNEQGASLRAAAERAAAERAANKNLGGTTMVMSDLERARREAEDLEAQYMLTLGIPAGGLSPFQRWQAQQAGPTIGAFRMESEPTIGLGLPAYLASQGIQGARTRIPTLLSQMAGLDPFEAEQRRGATGGFWNDILQAAAAQRWGRFMGPQMAETFPRQERMFEMGAGMGLPSPTAFLNLLRQRYGLF